MRFFELAVLRRGHDLIFGQAGELHIDLAHCTDAWRVTNDHEFLASCGEGVYFFVSGGGTLLLENRYLLVVRRNVQARVNPGQWSMFTGRADGPHEWMNPKALTRELFEELVVLVDGRPARFSCPSFSEQIELGQAKRVDTTSPVLLIEPYKLPTRPLTVAHGGATLFSEPVFWHVNQNRDINVIYLFSCELPLSAISACDGERKVECGGRLVGALDIRKMVLYESSGSFESLEGNDASSLPMSSHLIAVIQALQHSASV